MRDSFLDYTCNSSSTNDKSNKFEIYEHDINSQIIFTGPLNNDCKDTEEIDRLNKVRLENPNRLLIGHININSLRNKFLML